MPKLKQVKENFNLTMAFIGNNNSGKSTLGLSATEHPMFKSPAILDLDNGLYNLKGGNPDTEVYTYDTYSELLNFAKNPGEHDLVVVDTMDMFWFLGMMEYMELRKKGLFGDKMKGAVGLTPMRDYAGLSSMLTPFVYFLKKNIVTKNGGVLILLLQSLDYIDLSTGSVKTRVALPDSVSKHVLNTSRYTGELVNKGGGKLALRFYGALPTRFTANSRDKISLDDPTFSNLMELIKSDGKAD